MFFDGYEIHIQAFEEILTATLMSGDSSSLTSQDFKILSFLNIKNSRFQNFKSSKSWEHRWSDIFEFFESQIWIDKIFPGSSQIFLDFVEVILV